jgi:uncharacterized phage protein (TIGR02218 family)
MQNISEKLINYMQCEVTTLATCWQLKLRDGAVLGFTEADFDLKIDNVVYQANTGLWSSAIESSTKLNADNLEVEGLLESEFITEQDILAGRYDHAEVAVFMVNYLDVSAGKLQLRTGWLDDVSLSGHRFYAEVRGLMQSFSKNIGELYSPQCRANFGDNRCKVDLSKYTNTGKVMQVISQSKFIDQNCNELDGYYNYGLVEFLSGENKGLRIEVKSSSRGEIELMLPLAFELKIDDEYKVIVGCDKCFNTCIQKFNNAVNFRGEPHVPQMEKLIV